MGVRAMTAIAALLPLAAQSSAADSIVFKVRFQLRPLTTTMGRVPV